MPEDPPRACLTVHVGSCSDFFFSLSTGRPVIAPLGGVRNERSRCGRHTAQWGDSSSFTESGGTLTGAGTLTVSGALTWTNGVMSGTGSTVVSSGGVLNLSSASASNGSMTLSRTLENDGTANWTGSPSLNFQTSVYVSGGSVINDGTWTANTSSYPYFYGSSGTNLFTNNGTLTVQGTGGGSFIIPFNNAGGVE